MWKERGEGLNNYLRSVAIVVALGSFTYGCCSAIIGSTIGQPGWYSYFVAPQNVWLSFELGRDVLRPTVDPAETA
ncbi:hypothetical protein CLAIMM_03413 [Cladophialophora immunda]|nr:hypothetical protein CLAIMM_03413 [Cladophialophora immunda]